jgi:hypothetical protein
VRATVVELGSWRSGCADGADDFVAQLDHHPAAEKPDMRQLGEWRDRIFAFRALSQREGVVLKRYASVSLVLRAIERVDAGTVAAMPASRRCARTLANRHSPRLQ